jgi:hypothetical protein
VTSFVSSQGCERTPEDGYTRTSYFADWILSNSGIDGTS